MPRLRSRDQLIPRVSAPRKQVASVRLRDRCRAFQPAHQHPEFIPRAIPRADERRRRVPLEGSCRRAERIVRIYRDRDAR